jgi:UPF0755 protein
MNWKSVSGIIVLLGLLGSGLWAWDKWTLWNSPVGSMETWCIEIGPDDVSPDSPSYWAAALPEAQRVIAWRGWSVRPGRYCESGEVPAHRIARRIATGEREEIPVIVPAKRHVADIAAAIANRMWVDSAALVKALDQDSMRWRIVPNTYRMYWEASADDVAARLVHESEKWWNRDRLKTAWDMGLTAQEVVTLASIVQEETARLDEAPRVAGLYLNRLKKGMLLQADPTLKFAIGDWEIQRLLDKDKRVDSPYNTYLNPGLPPGPIRIPEPTYIDAVLQAEKHHYLYMCAKPDGSGRHAFAARYADHLRNARAWQNMLNREQIYR